MSQHTPGEWRRGWITSTVTAREGKTLVADCRGNGSQHPATEDECEANARLIRAAPELLEAAEAALAGMDCEIRDDGSGQWISTRPAGQFLEGQTALRIAIAKARGEESTRSAPLHGEWRRKCIGTRADCEGPLGRCSDGKVRCDAHADAFESEQR